MKHLFGPVPSRRLGRSLGIDPIPSKTCNWNCIYCQLGRSVPVQHTFKAYYPLENILDELDEALAEHGSETDWITIVGSGEPTLYEPLDELVNGVKTRTSLPLAVITNGSTLYRPSVRKALAAADVVMPSLDAGTPELYKRINRPHPEASFRRLMEGMTTFRDEYTGELWVEVMLVKDMNDSEEALEAIAACLKKIRPDQVHLNLPVRPPAESWVVPASMEGIERARKLLGKAASVVSPASGVFTLDVDDDMVETLLAIVSRHPMSEDDLRAALAEQGLQVDALLPQLEASNRFHIVERHGRRFWTAGPSVFPEQG